VYIEFWINLEGKRPLGRTRWRWEDNVRMGLREIDWEGVDLIYLVEDRDHWQAVVNTIMIEFYRSQGIS
jgi:hypothetical protein